MFPTIGLLTQGSICLQHIGTDSTETEEKQNLMPGYPNRIFPWNPELQNELSIRLSNPPRSNWSSGIWSETLWVGCRNTFLNLREAGILFLGALQGFNQGWEREKEPTAIKHLMMQKTERLPILWSHIMYDNIRRPERNWNSPISWARH